MYETLLHPHQVEPITPPLPISVASANLKRLEIRKEEKRLRQIASAQRSAASAKRKRVVDEEEGEGEESTSGVGRGEAGVGVNKKKAKMTGEGGEGEMLETSASASSATRQTTQSQPPPTTTPTTVTQEPEQPETKMSVSKTFPEVRGHTSYLTFAVFFPPCMTGTSANASVDGSGTSSGGGSVEGTPEVVMEDNA